MRFRERRHASSAIALWLSFHGYALAQTTLMDAAAAGDEETALRFSDPAWR